MTRLRHNPSIVQMRAAIDIAPPSRLANAARALRITVILLLLFGWFVVVGLMTVADIVRRAVIRDS